ncbi:MAG: FHA domain-containing protein [Rubrivivax sp.]|nr:FHA domain-containing protein [Rubrivivax sp.]
MLSLKIVRGAENAQGVRAAVHVPPEQARFVVGRDPSCDWPIPDKQLALSARHCEIVRIEGRQVLRDTSTNGTFLNNSRERLPADHVLRHGDLVKIGNYVIEVAVVPDAQAGPAAARPAAQAAPPAPRRGGDPAAMVGSDWERASSVSRGAAVPADVKTGLTRISKPPTKEALQEMLAAAPPVEVAVPPGAAADTGDAPAREAVRRAPPGTADVLQRIAGGLGVPLEALGTADPGVAADRVARLLRMTVLALHRQLGLQARQLDKLGCRLPAAAAQSEAASFRSAAGPDAALAALLGAGDDGVAVLVQANKELGLHSARLAAAFEAAGKRLCEQLAPAAVERLAEGADDAVRLWKIYSSLWTSLGIGVGKPWSEGYADAAASYLAAAYDDPKLVVDSMVTDKPAG